MASAGQAVEGRAKFIGRDRALPLLAAAGIILAMAVIVVLTRLYHLSDTPPGIINDEGANGVDALQVLQGEHAVFFAEKASGREAMAIYATALTTRLLGPSLLAFHLPAALPAHLQFLLFLVGPPPLWKGRRKWGTQVLARTDGRRSRSRPVGRFS